MNALIEDNEKKRQWSTGLVQESQAQTEVLRQHEIGQQVLAEVIKQMMGQQQQHSRPSQQTVTQSRPIVTEVNDDGDRLDFMGGQSPNAGPPNGGNGNTTRKQPRAPKVRLTLKNY